MGKPPTATGSVPVTSTTTVKAERYVVVEGKTPEIGSAEARTLLKSIDVSNRVGLRGRAKPSVLVDSAARGGAVARLMV